MALTEQQRIIAENNIVKSLGLDPKLITEDDKINPDTELGQYISMFRSTMLPATESKSSTGQKAIAETERNKELSQSAKRGAYDQAFRKDMEARREQPDAVPYDAPLWEQNYLDQRAQLSRDMLGSDIYSDSTRTSTTKPRERQTLFVEPPESFPTTGNPLKGFGYAGERQVSVPDLYRDENSVPFQPTVEYRKAVDDSIIADAGKDAVKDLHDYLLRNKEDYSSLSRDEQNKEIWNVITRLQRDMSGKGAHVLATAPDAELEAASIFGAKQTGSTIPEISEAGAAYLKSLRSNITKRKYGELVANDNPQATSQSLEFATSILGKPEWWQDPEMKKTMLSKDPEFEGMLGMGVYRYPSGATVESDPAYVARMIASPANFAIGAAYGGIAEALPSSISNPFLEERRKSGAADVTDDMSWYDRTVTHALDNVAKNRAIAEEAYDLSGAVTGSDLFKKLPGAEKATPYIRDATYIAGLATDVVAMPVVPGVALVTDISKAAKASYEAEKTLLGLSRAGKVSLGEHVANAVGAGPVDMRLLVATKLSDAALGAHALEDAIKRVDWKMDIAGDYEKLAGNPLGAVSNSNNKLNDLMAKANASLETAERGGIPARLLKTGDLNKETILFRNNKILADLENVIGKESAIYKEAALRASKGENLLDYSKELEKAIPPALTKEIDGSFNLVKKYSEIGDKAFLGKAGALSRTTNETIEDVKRWITTTAKASPELTAYLKENNITGLKNIAAALVSDSNGRAHLIKAISDEHSLARIFKAQPGVGNFFLLTSNTAVSSRRLGDKILDAASKTAVSKAITSATPVRDAAIKTMSGTKRAISGGATTSKIALTKEGMKEIVQWIESNLENVRMENLPMENLLAEAKSGMMSTQSARIILGLQIDEVSRTRFGNRISALGKETIGKMSVSDQNRLLTPVVLREGKIRKTIKGLVSEFNVVDSPISANAQKVLNNIQQEMSSMEKTIRIKIQEIKTNKAVAALYFLGEKPTDREAMLALVFQHPRRESLMEPTKFKMDVREAAQREISANIVTKIVRDLAIHNLPVRASLSDWFRPVNISLKSFLEKIPLLNDKLDSLTVGLFERLRESYSNEDSVKIIQSYIEDVNKVGEPYIKNGFAPISPDRTEELLSAIYFHAQKDEILEYHMDNLISEYKPKISDTLKAKINEHTLLHDKMIEQMIAARTEHMIAVNAGQAEDYSKDLQIFMDKKGQEVGWAHNNIMKSKDGPAFIESIDNLAYDVIDNYGMSKANAGESLEWLENISKGEKEIDPNKIGDIHTVETIKKIVGDSFDASKFSEYFKEMAKRDAKMAAWALGSVTDGIKWLRNQKYTFMLNLRPRFHGMNFLTAPFIMMSTIGGETTASSMTHWLQGAWLSALSSDTKAGDLLRKESIIDSARLNAVAFKDIAGRPYTYRDLADIVRNGGILKSQKGISSAADAISKTNETFLQKGLTESIRSAEDVEKIYKAGEGIFNNIISATTAFAEWSDGSFRMSVLIDSLQKGEDVSQAVQKARAALFDYGRMSDWEKKYINSWMAFYSFQRAAAVNVLTNIVENPTRLANQMKLTKGYVWGEHDRKTKDLYEKEYTQSRPLIGLVDGVDKERYAIYLPGMPVADSVFMLAKIFFAVSNKDLGSALSIETERMDPALKSLMGGDQKTKKMIFDTGYIDPRDIAWLKATGGFEAFEACFGDFKRTPALAGEPSWGGMKYSMKDNGGNVNKKAANAYWTYKNWFVPFTIGGDTILKDFAPLVAELFPAGITTKGIQLTTDPWEQLGVTTNIPIDSPTEIYTKKTQEQNYKLETLGPDNKTRSTN